MQGVRQAGLAVYRALRDTGSAEALVQLADVGSEHLAGSGSYATSLAQVTDGEIGAADVNACWVLTLADGRRVVVRSVEQLRRKQARHDFVSSEPTLLAESGWTFSHHLQPGWQIAAANGRRLAVQAVRTKQGPQQVYNLAVEATHTYFVGNTVAWAHNSCPWQDLNRIQSRMQAKGARAATVAQLRVNGRKFAGYSQRTSDASAIAQLRNAGLRPVRRDGSQGENFVGIFANHAEGHAFLRAWNKGVRGGIGDLFVSRMPCHACIANMQAAARGLGLERLNVFYRDTAGRFSRLILN